jgi:hypothetical protein
LFFASSFSSLGGVPIFLTAHSHLSIRTMQGYRLAGIFQPARRQGPRERRIQSSSSSILRICSIVTGGDPAGSSMTWKPFTTRVRIGACKPRRTNSDTALPTVISRLSAYAFTWGMRSSSNESVVRMVRMVIMRSSSRTNREHHSTSAHTGRNKSRVWLRLPKKEISSPARRRAPTIHSIRAPIAPSRSGSGEVSLYRRSRRSRRCCPGRRVRLLASVWPPVLRPAQSRCS